MMLRIKTSPSPGRLTSSNLRIFGQIAEFLRAAPLFFDMDGLLIDSEIAHKRAKEQAFRRFGIELSNSICSSYVGRPDATNRGNPSSAERIAYRVDERRD
jgi:hypothetical protein